METRDAWNRMNSDTKALVLQLWKQYQSSGSQSALKELRAIFENHGADDPTEREVERLF